MNRTRRFLCTAAFVFYLLSAAAISPRPSSADADWLPIQPADLALKDNPASPGANAMILYREGDVVSQEPSVHEYVRIKIFTQEGTKEGNVELPVDGQSVNIVDIHARTIQPDGSIVNFDGKVFDKTVTRASGVKYLAKTFTLPDVHPGSIIEYRYREQRAPFSYVNDNGLAFARERNYYISKSWTITSRLYTRDARFTIKPYSHIDNFANVYADPLAYREYGLPAGIVPVKQPDGSYAIDVHDVAALQKEAYMPPARSLEVRVDFYYVEPNIPEDDTPEHFWNRTGKVWSDQIDRFVNKKETLDKDLTHTVGNADAPEVKLRKIYARVQKIRNLSMEEVKSDQEQKQRQLEPNNNVEDVLKHGYATGRELNYTFVALARDAGFSAGEIFVADRNVVFFLPEKIDPSQLSADIVWVHAGTQDYYLDPAASAFPFGMLPWYETNTRGVRCSKAGGEIVTVPPSPPSQATIIRTVELEIDSSGQATGKLQVEYTGQFAAARRGQFREEDEAGRRKSIGDEIRRWLPAGSTFEVAAITNWDDKDVPFRVEGTAIIPHLGTAVGGRMRVPASLFQAPQTAAFHAEQRLYPVYFNYPYKEIDDVKLHVPAEYKIESVPPADTAKQAEPGMLTYEISATQQGGAVELKRVFILDGSVFPVDSYPALRKFFNTVKTDDGAQIFLQIAESQE
jgi:Domain of Unknown Function with PDB structure (DUF3857)